MRYPTPSRKDHQKFCETEGWAQVRDAVGRTGTQHLTFELTRPDGTVLRTRISHPPDKTDIRKGLFAHILRDRLCVTIDEFWTCVNDGQLPDRGDTRNPQGDPIPSEVVYLLINRVGMQDADVRKLSKADAIETLNAFWTKSD